MLEYGVKFERYTSGCDALSAAFSSFTWSMGLVLFPIVGVGPIVVKVRKKDWSTSCMVTVYRVEGANGLVGLIVRVRPDVEDENGRIGKMVTEASGISLLKTAEMPLVSWTFAA